ncbi:MAG: prepilin-type N-terminal cleavage/methylation domain-containing protein [Tenericutes bacterium]|nr:prepilin-type N-terminal cleavage/methylation domain-containing protein [Mycoplasmatota bacterium]
MKKNAFTLVELLAVIAILAILIIIALPNILKMFNNAKKNSFVSESRSVYKTAEQKYITGNSEYYCYSNFPDEGCEELDMTGRKNIDYYIMFNEEGKIDVFYMRDDNYCIMLDYEDYDEFGVEDLTSDRVFDENCGHGQPE